MEPVDVFTIIKGFFVKSDLGPDYGAANWACSITNYHRHLSVEEIVVLKLRWIVA